MKLIFFGTGNYALSVIDELKKEFDITVFTTEKEAEHPKDTPALGCASGVSHRRNLELCFVRRHAASGRRGATG